MATPTPVLDDVIDSSGGVFVNEIDFTFQAAVPGGQTVTCFACVMVVYGSGLPSTITDSEGNVWALQDSLHGDGGTSNQIGLYKCSPINAISTSTTFPVTVDGTNPIKSAGVRISYYTGNKTYSDINWGAWSSSVNNHTLTWNSVVDGTDFWASWLIFNTSTGNLSITAGTIDGTGQYSGTLFDSNISAYIDSSVGSTINLTARSSSTKTGFAVGIKVVDATGTLITVTPNFVWGVRGLISKTPNFKWNTLKLISKTPRFIWNTLSGSQVIVTPRFIWNTIETITKTVELDWSVNKLISKTSNLKWKVLSTITKTPNFKWSTKKLITKSSNFKWSVLSVVTSTPRFIWSVGARIIKTANFKWRVHSNKTWTPIVTPSTTYTELDSVETNYTEVDSPGTSWSEL